LSTLFIPPLSTFGSSNTVFVFESLFFADYLGGVFQIQCRLSDIATFQTMIRGLSMAMPAVALTMITCPMIVMPIALVMMMTMTATAMMVPRDVLLAQIT